MRYRRAIATAATVAVLAAIAGCGAEPAPGRVEVALAAPSPTRVEESPTGAPAATADATPPPPTIAPPTDTTPGGVALPTCADPEVRPDWWTPTCGDAGYQPRLTWDTWSEERATANAAALDAFADRGETWNGPARVVADRPRRADDGRYLYTRVVVTYERGAGPDGRSSDTWDAWEMWDWGVWSVEFERRTSS